MPPLVILAAIVALSNPYIRHRVHELFYYSHTILGIVYFALLWWHGGNLLDCWAYLWAALGLWLASYLARIFYYTQPLNLKSAEYWFEGAPMTLEAVDGSMTKMQISAPNDFNWTPGQHVFIRIPAISKTDNHPFTIASIASCSSMSNEKAMVRTLLLMVRSYTSFTHGLVTHGKSAVIPRSFSAWIDGPYGGINRPLERIYHELILICGGSGITACLPWIAHVVDAHQLSKQTVSMRRAVLHWAVRDPRHAAWVRAELEEVLLGLPEGLEFKCHLHITAAELPASHALSRDKADDVSTESSDIIELANIDLEADLKSKDKVTLTARTDSATKVDSTGPFTVHQGRPSIRQVLSQEIRGPKAYVFGCGPESMRVDTANAVASLQSLIWQEKSANVKDISLHLETFGW